MDDRVDNGLLRAHHRSRVPLPSRPATGHPRQDAGAIAERAVVEHLAAAGLEILAVNLRVGRLELDVVARDGAVVAVVEVRTRGAGAWVRALDSVDAKKRDRVRRAGERLWLERFASDPTVERMRFDVAAVELRPGEPARVEIVKGAF